MLSLPIAYLHPPPVPCLFLRHPNHTSFFVSPRFASPLPAASQCRAGPMTSRCSISQVDNYGRVDDEKNQRLKWKHLYRRLSSMGEPNLCAATVLDQWEEEHKTINKWEVCRVVKELRRFGRYNLGLDIYEWLAARRERCNFNASDAAILLDLLCKVRGISFAEDYFSGLSEELKDKRTYASLLNAYAYTRLKHRAEGVFETMKNKGYATDSLVFNVMMTLYMKIGEHDKVTAIVHEMKERNIKLDAYSYNIWITAIGAVGDVYEMEQVLELMNKDPGVSTTWTTYCTLADLHIRRGKVDKAVKYLKDAENRMTGQERKSFNYLINLYTRVSMKEEVYRIWEWYKSNFKAMHNSGYGSMISALIKLNDIDGAEKLYNEWLTSTSRYDPRICNILVSYYVNQGSIEEAESCVERLVNQGGAPDPITWELFAEREH